MALQFYERRTENDTRAALHFVRHSIRLYEQERAATVEEMLFLGFEIQNIHGHYLHRVKRHRLTYLREKHSTIMKDLEFFTAEEVSLVSRLNNVYNHGGLGGDAEVVREPQGSAEVVGEPQGSAEEEPQDSFVGEPQGTAELEPQGSAVGEPQGSAEGEHQANAEGENQANAEEIHRETVFETSNTAVQLLVNVIEMKRRLQELWFGVFTGELQDDFEDMIDAFEILEQRELLLVNCILQQMDGRNSMKISRFTDLIVADIVQRQRALAIRFARSLRVSRFVALTTAANTLQLNVIPEG